MSLQLLGFGHLHCGVPSLWKGVLYFPTEALVRRWFVPSMGAFGGWDCCLFRVSLDTRNRPINSVNKAADTYSQMNKLIGY